MAGLAVDGAGWGVDFLTSLGKKYNPNKLSIVRLEESAAYNPVAKNLMDDIGRFGDDAAENAGKNVATGSAATRINIKTGDNKTGMTHAWNNHGGDMSRTNKSQFTISKDEVISILKDKNTVNTPAYRLPSGDYVRNVDTGRIIGHNAKGDNPGPTSMITVITDKKGNLVTTYPSEPKP